MWDTCLLGNWKQYITTHIIIAIIIVLIFQIVVALFADLYILIIHLFQTSALMILPP